MKKSYPSIHLLDWATIEPHVTRLMAVVLEKNNITDWLQEWSDLTAAIMEETTRIYRAVAENTADPEAEKRYHQYLGEIAPRLSTADQELKQKLLAVENFEPEPDQILMMKRFRTEASLFREENVPIQSEIGKLAIQYQKTVGGITITWDGRTETLQQAALHLQEPERATRERAWRTMMDRWAENREALNALYLTLLEKRRQLARNAGFSEFRSFHWLQLGRFDYTPENCFEFHNAIAREVVPLAEKLYNRKASELGFSALRPWDVDFDPAGEPLRPFASAEELEAGARRVFEQVDPAFAGYFSAMHDGYLDLPSRPNKRPGAFCSGFPVSGKPYIFMNAVGTHDDVQTLLHEGGHAFHFMESSRQSLVWNQHGPMEFCEVASMGMELLAVPYLAANKGGFYTEADARRAYAEKLETVVRFLPYMAVVDAFQQWVYTDSPARITAADLDEKWSELWDRFMRGINYGGLQAEKESGWHRKAHIFTAPFYYVEYGLAEVGALQVWRNALRDQTHAVEKYRAALALGDTRTVPELYQAAGIRFAFDQSTVGALARLIEQKLDELTA